MTSIKLNTDLGGHKAGDTIDTTTGAADYLVNEGYAEATSTIPKAKGRAPKSTLAGDGGGGDSDEGTAETVG